MTQESIVNDDGVQQVLSELKGSRCALESFRDGRIIDGLVCRMTIGRLALMGAAGCKIFSSDNGTEIDENDVLVAWWFTIEDNVDKAVYIADDEELMSAEIGKLRRRCSPIRISSIVDEVQGWLTDISEAMPQGDGNDSGGGVSPNWWTGALDIIASAYGWDEEFILWYLPLTRAIKYQERICARVKGEAVSDDISDDVTQALERIEEMKDNG
jgi:hypothetical protein